MKTGFVIFFLIIIPLIVLALELYFNSKWSRFVKQRNWSPILSTIPYYLTAIMITIYISASYLKMFSDKFYPIVWALFIISNIWILPKLVIVPLFVLGDLYNYFKKKYLKYFPISQSNLEKQKSEDRRIFLQNASWLAAGIPFLITSRGLTHTAYDIRLHKAEIPIENLPYNLNEFRIVQLSDIHFGSFINTNIVKEAVSIVNKLNPDLICITGDFINVKVSELDYGLKELKKLKAKHGVYGCLGNHDHYVDKNEIRDLVEQIESIGVKLLINENKIIDLYHSKINIVGVDNEGIRQQFADWDKAFDGISSKNTTILLCHDPINWDKNIRGKRKVDLTLSGHTHGGQVSVDFWGETLSPARLVYKQYAGLYSDNFQHLYVNRGFGTSGPPIRLGFNPEITLITFKPTESMV